MTWTPPALMRYADAEYGQLLSAAGLPTGEAGPSGSAVLRAYLDLGVTICAGSPDPVLSDQQQADVPWLVDYYILRSIVRALAMQVDVATSDQREARSQRYKQAQQLLLEAAQAIDARGYGPTTVTLGRIQLDFLEPFVGSGGVPWWGGE